MQQSSYAPAFNPEAHPTNFFQFNGPLGLGRLPTQLPQITEWVTPANFGLQK